MMTGFDSLTRIPEFLKVGCTMNVRIEIFRTEVSSLLYETFHVDRSLVWKLSNILSVQRC